MAEKNYGRILSKPRLLVNDNAEGTISTTKTTWVARSSETSGTGDNPVIVESTDFEEFPSGIELIITPHISEGDLLRLEIEMKRSSQASASDLAADEPPPDKTENDIKTVVTVPDKSTIILGGIIQMTQSKGGSKIPLFGDLPIVGGLFRSIDDSDTQSKLYIFVKADILRPDESTAGLPDLERISKLKQEAFEKAERQFQEYQPWPGLDAEPLDPLRVLESE